MVERSRIFNKRRLSPGQLRAVAALRLDDARTLIATRVKARANGAMYIGGFAIECLLKALLLDRHRNLQAPVDPATLSIPDRTVFELLYSHALDDMLGFLPEVQSKLQSLVDAQGQSLWPAFNGICAQWTVYARYAPTQCDMDEARRFVEIIGEVKQWLSNL